jgi:hypothetical protein
MPEINVYGDAANKVAGRLISPCKITSICWWNSFMEFKLNASRFRSTPPGIFLVPPKLLEGKVLISYASISSKFYRILNEGCTHLMEAPVC